MWGYFTTFFIFSCLTFFLTEKAFVHEWAHFQWGVFDEYNNEEKFYTSKGRTEAVRCVHFDFALPNNFTVQPIFPWVTFKIPAFCLISSGPVNWVPTLWIVAVCSLPGASACDLYPESLCCHDHRSVWLFKSQPVGTMVCLSHFFLSFHISYCVLP